MPVKITTFKMTGIAILSPRWMHSKVVFCTRQGASNGSFVAFYMQHDGESLLPFLVLQSLHIFEDVPCKDLAHAMLSFRGHQFSKLHFMLCLNINCLTGVNIEP